MGEISGHASVVDEQDELQLVASGIGSADEGGIFLIDGPEEPVRLSDTPSTGMTSWDRGLELAWLHWNNDDPSLAGEVEVFGSRSCHVTHKIESLREPHSVIRHGDHLAMVSTLRNMIIWVDDDGRLVRQWRAPGSGDCWHINSLTVKNGNLIASAFGRFTEHRGWAMNNSAAGSGIVFDVESGEDLLGGLNCPHDPLWIDDSWLVCNSGTKELLRCSADGSVIDRIELAGWTRGLAVGAKKIYVGVSAHRLLAQEGQAKVVELDRESLMLTREWQLPCPEVFALCWVDPLVSRSLAESRQTSPAVSEAQRDRSRPSQRSSARN